jgi:hypothetical protein
MSCPANVCVHHLICRQSEQLMCFRLCVLRLVSATSRCRRADKRAHASLGCATQHKHNIYTTVRQQVASCVFCRRLMCVIQYFDSSVGICLVAVFRLLQLLVRMSKKTTAKNGQKSNQTENMPDDLFNLVIFLGFGRASYSPYSPYSPCSHAVIRDHSRHP